MHRTVGLQQSKLKAIGLAERRNGRRAAKVEKLLRNVWIRTVGERKSNRAGAMECIRTATMETGIAANQTIDQATDKLTGTELQTPTEEMTNPTDTLDDLPNRRLLLTVINLQLILPWDQGASTNTHIELYSEIKRRWYSGERVRLEICRDPSVVGSSLTTGVLA
ncbi:hypothetical protein PoB_007176500 [Plakobranchus ocellatus]|uniref:Uncharacterized protein n=1 Tax=Plakobranchus ocellatus TaxID=259542 RepID=A0AAV4DMW7_9GAST|nr:hypothetical protein PoB_007176500 [Plakobranchus ocellatus]